MSYLRFDKTLMINLQESLPREILRTNRSGAYHCTTIVDCNTRKYHGLLVIPVPNLDDENHVLLSSLDETVIQHGAEFNLGLHKYQGNHFSPNGHKYIREFDCENIPTTTYRVGGVILRKEKIFVHHENRILIRYTLVDAHSATTLRFRPFLAFRSVREYTHENAQASRDYQLVENGIKTCMYPGYPELFMQLNKKNEFHFQPDWYRGIEYPKEQERGYDFNEDLYVPGYFEVDIKKGESVVFSAGISEISPRKLKQTFESEVADRTPRDSFYHCLKNSAHQFHNKQGEEHYVLAGYPWFKCRARDLFISLPGLTLALGEQDEFEDVMKTAEKAIREFINGEPSSYKIYEMEHPDVLLWAVWALQQYAKETSRENCRQMYGNLLEEIVDYIRERRHDNLFLHENGLLYTNGTEKAVTWMNSTANGRPVIPRTGYIVEVNALWYNAVCYALELAREQGDRAFVQEWEMLPPRISAAFNETFVLPEGYLADYVDEQGANRFIRPNMILACSLPYKPIDEQTRLGVIRTVRQHLLTPKGLRTLSPRNPLYRGSQEGSPDERDFAAKNGSVWPWLLSFYVKACFDIDGDAFLPQAEEILAGFEEDIQTYGIGSIGELFDADPPFAPRGAISQAWSVAAVLDIYGMILARKPKETPGKSEKPTKKANPKTAKAAKNVGKEKVAAKAAKAVKPAAKAAAKRTAAKKTTKKKTTEKTK